MIRKSFLKWSGGKHRLINQIKQHLPKGEQLIEPFVGSGAVFINTDFNTYLLGDLNSDLMNVYQLLRSDVSAQGVIDKAQSLFRVGNCAEFYYQIRDEFNHSLMIDAGTRAAMFIYLNRHCFNGLVRYNKSGKYNVPFGKYGSVYFPLAELIAFSKKLRSADLYVGDFDVVIKSATNTDVIYCDPPYLPLSATANFTGYTPSGFSIRDHIRLAKCLIDAVDRGASVVVSNSYTAEARKIYDHFIQHTVTTRRSVGSAKTRGNVIEMLAVMQPCDEIPF